MWPQKGPAVDLRRSREGAWIEIRLYLPVRNMSMSRSREGAWIEIRPRLLRSNERLCRSREGAWIEIAAPVRETCGI